MLRPSARTDSLDGRFGGDQIGLTQFEQRHRLLRVERYVFVRTRLADIFSDHSRWVAAFLPEIDADIAGCRKESCRHQSGSGAQPFVRHEAAEHFEPFAGHAEGITHVLVQIVRQHGKEIFHRTTAVYGRPVAVDAVAFGFGDKMDFGSRGIVDDFHSGVIRFLVLAAVEERPSLKQFYGVVVQLVLAVGGEHQCVVALVRTDGVDCPS